jgi:hypothetical protein
MKNFFLLVLTVLMANICSAQEKPGFVLTLEFAPSFMSPSQLVIQELGDSASIEITVNKKYAIRQKKRLWLPAAWLH